MDGAINLAGALRDQGKFGDAIEILRQAIFADQRNAPLWNTLGSVLLESGDPFQAETFYREALSVDPGFARAWHNLAYALDMQGDMEGALAAYDRALALPVSAEDAAQMRHGRSFSLLAAGRLEDGWDEYEIRMKPALSQATVFVIAAQRWDRDPAALAGKRVLLVGEQGLGDEILFMNAAADMERAIGADGHLMIACTRRLIPLMARAFPRATVGAHNTFEAEARKFRTAPWLEKMGGADLWAPMGDTICAFRRRLEDFPETRAFLPADPARVAEMRAALEALGPGMKVGVVWRSMLMTASRAKYFSPFAQWAPVLKTPGVQFVNLQYGDVSAELARAKAELGVTIHEIPGLNVKDDLDGVAALGAALDVSIGPSTASTNLTACAGGETWIVGYRTQWTSLGTDRLPFYPGVRMFCPPGWNRWDEAMAEIGGALAERAAQGRASRAA
jgi:tetratricopeptide (TPR) repeat protein